MNSLIQTLFMTPEFRRGLYKWNFDETYERKLKDEDKNGLLENGEHSKRSPEELKREKKLIKEKNSIPRQLQLLFARLQLRNQRAVKTKVIDLFLDS